jgi:methionine-rich copper-binding protein CopC
MVWKLTAVRRLAAVVLLVGLWLLASGTAAQAHTVLRSSDSANGASVERAPLGHLQR